MLKSDFQLIVRRVLEDYDLDDRNLAVDEFIDDLMTTIEYESDMEFEDDPEDTDGLEEE